MALAKYFQEGCSEVTALHEPKPSRILRIASSRFMAGHHSKDDMARLLQSKRKKILTNIETPIYVESNPYLYGFLDVLGNVFDRPQIVHITRDPRTMVRSAINFGSQRGLKWLFSAVVPYWTLRPEQMNPNPSRKWWEMTPVERMAWHWRIVNEHLSRGAELYGEDYRRFRFEDLFHAERPGLSDLADWIGVSHVAPALAKMASRPVNRSKRNDVANWDQWADSDRKALLDQCGQLMQYYRYKVEDSSPDESVPTR